MIIKGIINNFKIRTIILNLLTLSRIYNGYIFGITTTTNIGQSNCSGGTIAWTFPVFAKFLIYATRKDEGAQGMEVSKNYYSVYHFSQRPTILTFCQFLKLLLILTTYI